MIKKVSFNVIVLLLLIFLATAGYSCATGRYLKTQSATEGEITGVYTVILYGGTSVNDVETIAVLMKEGTPYSFEVFRPEFDYRTIKGVPGKEALEKAEKFVSFHHNFWKIQLNKIVDGRGNTVGYEVRPLYYPGASDKSDILDVDYKNADGKIIVYIRLYEYPEMERMPFEGGRGFGPK